MKSETANVNMPAQRPNGQPGVEPGLAPEGLSSAASTGDDFFDLTKLRLSQDFEVDLGVKKAPLTVPVRKPDRNEKPLRNGTPKSHSDRDPSPSINFAYSTTERDIYHYV
jgi:hypothetical protein